MSVGTILTFLCLFLIPGVLLLIAAGRLLWGLFRRRKDPNRQVSKLMKVVDIILTVMVAVVFAVIAAYLLMFPLAIIYM